VRFDTLWAKDYDEHWGHIYPTHAQFLSRFLALCPAQCTILDAACGTGKYWPMILESGRSVLGIDQSQQMLLKAKTKFPDVETEKLGLQEMYYKEEFDGIICMDAVEMVFPEDWPLVLSNFHRALKSDGHLYFTVEITTEKEIRAEFIAGRQLGLPIVEGEHTHEGGYHYYPPIEQVKQWIGEAQFEIVAEAEGDEYYHFLVCKG